jgi:hypothetical protein
LPWESFLEAIKVEESELFAHGERKRTANWGLILEAANLHGLNANIFLVSISSFVLKISQMLDVLLLYCIEITVKV